MFPTTTFAPFSSASATASAATAFRPIVPPIAPRQRRRSSPAPTAAPTPVRLTPTPILTNRRADGQPVPVAVIADELLRLMAGKIATALARTGDNRSPTLSVMGRLADIECDRVILAVPCPSSLRLYLEHELPYELDNTATLGATFEWYDEPELPTLADLFSRLLEVAPRYESHNAIYNSIDWDALRFGPTSIPTYPLAAELNPIRERYLRRIGARGIGPLLPRIGTR